MENVHEPTHSKIDDTIVETGVEKDTLVLYVVGCLDFGVRPVSVFYGEWKTSVQSRNQVDLQEAPVVRRG